MKSRKMIIGLVAIVICFLPAAELLGAEVPRMSKEELKPLLGSPDVLIIDIRTGADWAASEFKIKGAVREEASKASNWIDKYPKDKTFVFYCA